jgi:fructuronate reductase
MSQRKFLCQAALAQLPARVRVPPYERAELAVGIVHFGPGAFHRAHQAWFIENLLAHDTRWALCEVSLRSREICDALERQNGLYTLTTLGEEVSHQVIGAVQEALVAPQNPHAVLERLESDRVRIVTVTVTEKGYCLDATGDLQLSHADIQADLRDPQHPTSLIGYLVEALRRRRDNGVEPPTIISCDNLADNGIRLKRAVKQLALLRDSDLSRWIDEQVNFPRTMVDSITPATTEASRKSVNDALTLLDECPVRRESFIQWVLEAHPGTDQPDWASAGVILTDDVSGYDRAKLRLLNGAHSSLAYLGLLAGHQTVAQAMGDPIIESLVIGLMRQDILPTLRAPRRLDLPQYVSDILTRFRNPHIHHQLAQIAWDGSQKLPVRLLGTITDNLEARRPLERLCQPIAAWMHFIRREVLRGQRIVDPLADHLVQIGRAGQNRASTDVPLFLELNAVFPASLAQAPPFRAALNRAYDALAGRNAE